jgi:hypothetical protein
MSKEQNHAIIFGASGLVGWSVLDQLLSNYPKPGSFSGVTAVINRPVAEPDWGLPSASSHRPGLQIVSGIDLLNGTADDLGRQLKERVPDVESVTHIFYFGTYIYSYTSESGSGLTRHLSTGKFLTNIAMTTSWSAK